MSTGTAVRLARSRVQRQMRLQRRIREERLRPHNSILRFILTFLIVAAACSQAQDYAIGADVSFASEAEQSGIVFKDKGVPAPVLEMLRTHGYHWVRLRMFHNPTDLPNNFDYTMASAQAAKKLGFHFLLDFHYSDTWADPGKQFLPKAWEGMSHAQLVQAVFDYTKQTIAAFRDAGVLPDMVQVGNEITNGMLWPDARLPASWDNFADLMKAGIAGVEAGTRHATRPSHMIHHDS